MAGSRELHACGKPALNDLDVPVDAEPVDHGICDDAAYPVHLGQFIPGRRPDGVEGTEVPGKRARRHRADVADAECDQDAPQRLRLGKFNL
jgi:hypothetical protein